MIFAELQIQRKTVYLHANVHDTILLHRKTSINDHLQSWERKKTEPYTCGGIPNSTNGLTSVGYAIVKDMTGLLLKIRITNKQ